jgi:histidine triad (HIT) family protein
MSLNVEHHSPDHCVFCRVIRCELPAARVHEDDITVAFMDIGQLNPGHTLVAIKRHAATLLDLSPAEAAAAMKTAQRIAQAIEKSFDPAGITLLQANGKEGEQTVFHFHIHVLPRHRNDGIGLVWPRKNPPPEQLEDYARQLREKLR